MRLQSAKHAAVYLQTHPIQDRDHPMIAPTAEKKTATMLPTSSLPYSRTKEGATDAAVSWQRKQDGTHFFLREIFDADA